jgi:hypothetical protein
MPLPPFETHQTRRCGRRRRHCSSIAALNTFTHKNIQSDDDICKNMPKMNMKMGSHTKQASKQGLSFIEDSRDCGPFFVFLKLLYLYVRKTESNDGDYYIPAAQNLDKEKGK